MNGTIHVEPLTAELRALMEKASAADHGHCAPFATHAFIRDAEIVGAVALFAPTLTFWARSTGLSKREALLMAAQARDLGLARRSQYLAACSTESPYYPVMSAFRFRRLGNADYFEVV